MSYYYLNSNKKSFYINTNNNNELKQESLNSKENPNKKSIFNISNEFDNFSLLVIEDKMKFFKYFIKINKNKKINSNLSDITTDTIV